MPRLIKRVDTLTAAADKAAAEKARGPALGIAWMPPTETVDAEQLQPGEYIALDLWLDEPMPPPDDQRPTTDVLRIARTAERVTTNPNDLGAVYDATGQPAGHIIRLDDGMVTYCSHAGDHCTLIRPQGKPAKADESKA